MIGLACKKCACTLQVAHANDTCKSRENTPNCLYRLAVYVSCPLSLGNEQTTSRSHQVFGVLYSLDLTIKIVDSHRYIVVSILNNKFGGEDQQILSIAHHHISCNENKICLFTADSKSKRAT